jgi:hypothetical protein
MKPILVTGAHRSGSTWVGKMLAASSQVAYFHEPLNIQHDNGFLPTQINSWFPYISQENEYQYLNDFRQMLDFRYDPWAHYRQFPSIRSFVGGYRNTILALVYRYQKRTPLIKDPLAIFSAEWLASRFDMQIVVLIRHPAAFAGSLKAKNWRHPFEHFLQQPLLMQRLASFRPEIEKFAHDEQDIIEQACLLWKIMYSVVREYKSTHPDWIFLRHEDISLSPVAEFEKLYLSLGLTFTSGVRRVIEAHSSGDEGSSSIIKRDSAANIFFWKKRLSQPELSLIKSRTGELASYYYDGSDW